MTSTHTQQEVPYTECPCPTVKAARGEAYGPRDSLTDHVQVGIHETSADGMVNHAVGGSEKPRPPEAPINKLAKER